MACATITTIGCGERSSSSGQRTLRQQIEEAVVETNPARRGGRLIRLAILQHDAKDIRGAQQTLELASSACEEVSDAAARARMFSLLTKAQVRLGGAGARDSLRRAEQAVAAIEDVEPRLKARADWAEAQAAVGDSAGARQTLATIEAAAAQLPDSAARVRVLCRVADSYADARVARSAEADRLFGEALLLAGTISDPRARCRAMTDVARAQSRLHRTAAADTLEWALQAARQIESPWSRAHALHDVALAVADRAAALKILQTADATAETIPEPDLRKQTLQMIRETTDRMRLTPKGSRDQG